jgi:hypothetical protein
MLEGGVKGARKKPKSLFNQVVSPHEGRDKSLNKVMQVIPNTRVKQAIT